MTAKTMSPLVEKQFLSRTRQVLVDNMLTESAGLTSMSVLAEDSKRTGALVVEGKVGQCGTATANGRLYERRLMEREVDRIADKIERRALLASVDHPSDGKSRIMDAGAICLGLRVEADGSVIGKYEIVEDSDGGRNLAAFLRRGCQIGMSSRGVGSTHVDASGHHVVGEDFRLHGFDFVADPACKDAFPTLVSEDIDPVDVSEAELRVRFPTLVEQIEDRARQVGAQIAEEETRETVEKEFAQSISQAREAISDEIKLEVFAEVRESLREDFAAKLVKALQEQRVQVEEVVRSELLSDPSVAGAKKFMEELAQRLNPYKGGEQKTLVDSAVESTVDPAEVSSLKEQLEHQAQLVQESTQALEDAMARQAKAEEQARSLGFRLFVERAISGKTHANEMREMIGDPLQFSNAEALRDRVAAVIKHVQEAHDNAEAEAAEKLARQAKIQEHKVGLAAEKAKIAEEQLDKVRTEFSDKVGQLTERFEQQLANRDTRLKERESQLEEAVSSIQQLQARLQKAEALAEQAELAAYAERRTIGHPRRDDIMASVQSGRVSNKQAVQQLAEQWDVRGSEPGGVSERVRRAMSRGREAPTAVEQLQEDRKTVPGLEGFDTTMGELRQLAGIGQDNNGRRRI